MAEKFLLNYGVTRLKVGLLDHSGPFLSAYVHFSPLSCMNSLAARSNIFVAIFSVYHYGELHGWMNAMCAVFR